MVSPISFTSTYKVNNYNRDFGAFSEFQHYAYEKENVNENVNTVLKDKIIEKYNSDGYKFEYKAELTLDVPDYMDSDVETFCANNGIEYKKYSYNDTERLSKMYTKIEPAPQGYQTVYIDVEKLDELLKNQDSNYEHCRNNYDEYFSKNIDLMIKCDDKIPASTLAIYSPSGNNELRNYVKLFDTENLNENQVAIYFVQQSDNPDHCIYFAFKDLGAEKIPVYVNKDSYEAGKILKLFK